MQRNAFQNCYRLLQQYPRFIERYIVQFTGDIGQWYNKNVNDGLILSNRNKQSESVRTIGELSLELIPQTSKRYFQNILLKTNQQFGEILPTTYIFQSHIIYNMVGKVM